jgi:hypothetical protein
VAGSNNVALGLGTFGGGAGSLVSGQPASKKLVLRHSPVQSQVVDFKGFILWSPVSGAGCFDIKACTVLAGSGQPGSRTTPTPVVQHRPRIRSALSDSTCAMQGSPRFTLEAVAQPRAAFKCGSPANAELQFSLP